jgi:hypothetical protein
MGILVPPAAQREGMWANREPSRQTLNGASNRSFGSLAGILRLNRVVQLLGVRDRQAIRAFVPD